VEDKNFMSKEQKGCHRITKGCKDQLLISKAIPQESKHRKKILFMAWIDYQKAFERVPHSWIIKFLDLIGINTKVISFTNNVMGYWRRRMLLHAENKLINRRHKNKIWNNSRGLTITTEILFAYSLSLNI
jgi:hypothetical protein